jgi:hypothetical protein
MPTPAEEVPRSPYQSHEPELAGRLAPGGALAHVHYVAGLEQTYALDQQGHILYVWPEPQAGGSGGRARRGRKIRPARASPSAAPGSRTRPTAPTTSSATAARPTRPRRRLSRARASTPASGTCGPKRAPTVPRGRRVSRASRGRLAAAAPVWWAIACPSRRGRRSAVMWRPSSSSTWTPLDPMPCTKWTTSAISSRPATAWSRPVSSPRCPILPIRPR